MPNGFLGRGVGPRSVARKGLAAPVPVAGGEKITNGGFDADTDWLKGEGWTIADGVAVHTGATSYLQQNFAGTAGWYLVAIDLLAINTNYVYVAIQSGVLNLYTTTATGTYKFSAHAPTTANVGILIATQANATIDNVSQKFLTLASLLSTRVYASPNCDISAQVTRTAGTQAGLVARLDSATNPQNFIIAYLDGAGNVKVDKCVGGVYTNVITGAVTYVAGRVLRLVCNGTSVTAYYNGAFVGTAEVTDAGIVSNARHGLFSTYAANTFAAYVNAVDSWITSETAPVPVAGAELLVNGGFENWTSPTNADNWAESLSGASTIEQDASIKYAGNYAAKMTFASAAAALSQTIISPADQWLLVVLQLRSSDATKRLNISGHAMPAMPANTWTQAIVTEYVPSGTRQYNFQRQDGGTYSIWLDEISVKPLPLASLMSTSVYASPNCDISAQVTRTPCTQAGLCARLDDAASPANFLIAYENGAGRLKVDKCLSGTYTNIIDGPVTYVAGAQIRLVCSGSLVVAWYNGLIVGANYVTDAYIIGNRRHGKFSTYASNTLTSFLAITT